jgi:ATP-binding cassette, subfamily B, bacterial PglK
VMYALIIRLTGKRLAIDGHRIARESTQVIKALQEGLGGIRDILIDGTQATYCEVYQRADLQLRRAQGDNQFVALSPRYGIEALGTLLIAALAYWLARQPGGVASAIPVLGALALGAQRLLPILQQAYSSWSQIRGGQASLQDTLALLDQPLPDHADRPSPKPLPFRNEITHAARRSHGTAVADTRHARDRRPSDHAGQPPGVAGAHCARAAGDLSRGRDHRAKHRVRRPG